LIPPVKEDGTPVSFAESVILRAQYVEYKLSHYLDKALESVFGFVSVLPGAFSAYRWECINGQPINEFLKGVRDEFDDTNYILPCSEANKYLAEDRIMCLEILAKKDEEWLIHYVPGSK
jgi:chitin synthase